MHLNTLFVSVVIMSMILMSFSLHAQQASSANKDIATQSDSTEFHCDNPRTQIDMNVCAGDDYRALDARLNALYKEQMERLDAKHKAELRSAQLVWIEFRDKSCIYEAGKDPESYVELQNIACLSRITRHRIEDLDTYLACTANGCP